MLRARATASAVVRHSPVGQTVVDKLTQFATAARNARAPEDTVPALSGAGIADD